MNFANNQTLYTHYNGIYKTHQNKYNATKFSNQILPNYKTPYQVPENSYGVPLPTDNSLRSYTSYEFAVMLQHKKRFRIIQKQIIQWEKELVNEKERSREELDQIKMYRLTVLNNIPPHPDIKFDLVPVYGVEQPFVNPSHFNHTRNNYLDVPISSTDEETETLFQQQQQDLKASKCGTTRNNNLKTPSELLLHMQVKNRQQTNSLEFPKTTSVKPLQLFHSIYPPFLLKNNRSGPLNELPLITNLEEIDELNKDEIKIYLNSFNIPVQTESLYMLKTKLAAVLGINNDHSYRFKPS